MSRSLWISFGTPSIPGTVFALSLPLAAFSSSRVKSFSRQTTQELQPCLWNGSTTPYQGPPKSLTEAFLKEEDLGSEDLERIVGEEVAVVTTYTCHLDPNEPRVGLQEIPDVQIGATNKDAGPP